MSNRNKKKIVQKGLAELKTRPGWDPANFTPTDPMARLRELDQERRSADAYDGASACEGCVAARAEGGDETALCEVHLMEAMGF